MDPQTRSNATKSVPRWNNPPRTKRRICYLQGQENSPAEEEQQQQAEVEEVEENSAEIQKRIGADTSRTIA